MKGTTRFASGWMFFGIVAVLAGWFSASPILATAQGTPGQNTICSSSSGCSTTVGSSAFIDASMFASLFSSPNLCSVLQYVLNPSITSSPPLAR